MKKAHRSIWSLLAVFTLICFLLLHAGETAASARAAMELAASSVIPSLFPFCVLSNYLIESGIAARWQPLFPPARRFGLEEDVLTACLLGTLCGYPVGAVVLARQCRAGTVRPESVCRALAVSTHASPAFLIAVAGGTLLGSYTAGVLLLAVQLLSALLVFFLHRPEQPFSYHIPTACSSETNAAAAFPTAVQTASLIMVQIAGFIVLCSVMLELLHPLLALLPGNGLAAAMLAGALEITNGLTAVSASSCSLRLKFLAAAALTGWSGLCVHFQVLSFTLPLRIPAHRYLLDKTLQSFCALLLALPCSLLLPSRSTAVSSVMLQTPPTDRLMLLWAALASFLFFYLLFQHGDSIMKEK